MQETEVVGKTFTLSDWSKAERKCRGADSQTTCKARSEEVNWKITPNLYCRWDPWGKVVDPIGTGKSYRVPIHIFPLPTPSGKYTFITSPRTKPGQLELMPVCVVWNAEGTKLV